MSHTRREFMKDAAVAGVVLSAGAAAGAEAAEEQAKPSGDDARCPYFDQPMYCKDLSKDGKPLCDR